jgi:anti-anti-sigma factor
MEIKIREIEHAVILNNEEVQDIHAYESILVLELSGRLGSSGARELLHEVRSRKDSGWRKFIINLGGVPYIDSAGLGALIGTFTMLRNGDRDVKFSNLTPKTKDLLEMTKLLTVLDTCEDEEDAIEALKDDRWVKQITTTGLSARERRCPLPL